MSGIDLKCRLTPFRPYRISDLIWVDVVGCGCGQSRIFWIGEVSCSVGAVIVIVFLRTKTWINRSMKGMS